MTLLSHEDALTEYQADFGKEFGFLIRGLTDRVSELHDEWDMFLYLFAERRERVELLNRASGSTARTIQGSVAQIT